MGEFKDLAAQFDPTNSKRKGDQFEIVCKWFLQNDPTYKSLFRKVWLWYEWPDNWPHEAGIDLVAEDRHGKLWAVQAKAEKDRVTHDGVSHFIAEASRPMFANLLLIATTDSIHYIGRRTMRETAKPVSIVQLRDLESAEVDWPNSLEDLRPAKPAPKKPWDHQRRAIKDVLKGFKTEDRGQMIMACGTGKTLTALFIKERLKAERTLVLVPSLSVLKQTMREWTASKKTDFDFLVVCSDETATKEDRYDAALSDTTELGVPPTTDPSEIATFLKQHSGPQVIFSTYQSSPQVAEAFKSRGTPVFDLVIADEAHRCAGPVGSDFATVLQPKAIKAKKRLFMTATPRIYSAAYKKPSGDSEFEYASMDDVSKFGKVFHRLSFGQAIADRLLTDYQVAVIDVDDAMCLDWAERRVFIKLDDEQITDAGWLAGQIGLAKAMKKFDLRRVISFHGRVKRSRDFARSMPALIDWLPARQRPSGRLWSEYVSGEMTTERRYRLLQDLKALNRGDRGLLSNARCLSEGVDVPALDGIAFIDPRSSEIDIVQAVGRAIRKAKPEKIGTIVIPVLIDPDQDPEAALKSSVFKPVWDVVRALRSHDDVLAAQLDEVRREMGRRRGGNPRLPPKILPLPSTVNADFAKAFNVKLVDLTTSTWQSWLGLLQEYAREKGTARVPFGTIFREQDLSNWASMQRYLYGIGQLEPEKVQELERLEGWSWDYRDDNWEEFLRRLDEFVMEFGHANVEKSYRTPDNYPLGSRVSVQRRKATRERREILEGYQGWVWNTQVDAWNRSFDAAAEFIREHGHSIIPGGIRVGAGSLNNWATKQRRLYTDGDLDDWKIKKLESVKGWAWDRAAQADEIETREWETGFEQLLRYGRAAKTFVVPADCQFEDYDLGGWVRTQRRLHSQNELLPERIARLNALDGWSWHPKVDQWDRFIVHLQKYVSHEGTANVPNDHVDEDDKYPLGKRVADVRSRKPAGGLSPERQELLETFPGWVWSAKRASWLSRLDEVEKELASLGAGKLPYGSPNYLWLNTQRNRAINHKFDSEQLDALRRVFPTADWIPDPT